VFCQAKCSFGINVPNCSLCSLLNPVCFVKLNARSVSTSPIAHFNVPNCSRPQLLTRSVSTSPIAQGSKYCVFCQTKCSFGINVPNCSKNWDQAVQNEFGSDYKVADWNDLVSYYNKNGAASFTLLMDGLGVKTTAAAVYWNGQKLYGGWRAYFIEWHNHNKPGYFWAHDNIDNYLVSLGSWTGARPILVVKK